jgi:carbamoyltransferase
VKILGINHDMFITSAALIEDGKILSAIAEERLTRQKLTRDFPINAIKYCLDQANCDINDIAYITNAYNPAAHFQKFNPIFSNHRRFRGDYLYSVPDNIFRLLKDDEKENDYIQQTIKLKNREMEIYYIRHHLCHAANGFFLSPFKDAAILTADGRGELDSATFSIGSENSIELLNNINIPHSIGSFYSTFTSFFGFRPNSDEWKVMALSSFTSPENEYYKKIKNIVDLKQDGTFELDLNFFKEHNVENSSYYSDEFINVFGPPKEQNDRIEKRYYDIASAMQKITEEILTHMLSWLQVRSKLENVVVNGGSFMNSVFNGKIKKATNFKNVFVSSCPDDSGLSIGSALYLYNHILSNKTRYVQKHNFYGPKYDDNEIKHTLDKYLIKYTFEDDINEFACEQLINGKLIGWFQGRMEFGQRALGNRSIIADPRDHKMKDKINSAIKYREDFRPFAPAILENMATEYFDIADDEKVPFMEKVFMIKEEKRNIIPSVTHIDGSGRLQTVSQENNPIFYSLISRFYEKTDVPVLLNTSFNINGEPIVCSPTDAIRTFYNCGLDILIIGNYVVKKL